MHEGPPEEKSDLAADEEPGSSDSLQDADLVDGERRPWWQRASTWRVLLPLLVTLVAVTVGLLLQLVAPFHFYKTVSGLSTSSALGAQFAAAGHPYACLFGRRSLFGTSHMRLNCHWSTWVEFLYVWRMTPPVTPGGPQKSTVRQSLGFSAVHLRAYGKARWPEQARAVDSSILIGAAIAGECCGHGGCACVQLQDGRAVVVPHPVVLVPQRSQPSLPDSLVSTSGETIRTIGLPACLPAVLLNTVPLFQSLGV